MPWIKPEPRPDMDEIVDLMVQKGVEVNGDLNYILFKFCKYYVKPSYGNYKNYKAELRECADIIHTEILVPYEMEKKRINGEI